ncbi:acylphosphatase [Pseudoxanthomonas sp. CF125]|uniref:acylphosphatase n=1 Tax=Pseudoxanthomonas sp. CF125 TaxID=1855303 RepID=UPI00088150B5|nr:acylphosphatase [Pseudoxanthomonas sp. CF125]SDQ95909.1 acylphosphatase [Pseudoxanthomonas sp. CF125]
MPASRFWVSGKVQGVFFRASTRQQALRLGLSGSVRNLADGRVEVIAAGDEESLETLARWLREGPPAATVAGIVREDWEGPLPQGFHIA